MPISDKSVLNVESSIGEVYDVSAVGTKTQVAVVYDKGSLAATIVWEAGD